MTVKEALEHVHVFRPQSSTKLLSTLEHLSDYLLDESKLSSSYRPLGMIVVDSTTAFYWQDRFDAEIARLELGQQPSGPEAPSTTKQIIDALKTLQAKFDCAILFTRSSTLSLKSRKAITTPHPEEPTAINPWTAFATLSLNMSRAPVPQFAPTMSIEECLRDKENRRRAVIRGRFVASLDRTTSELWGSGMREAVDKLPRRGNMEFRVTEHGVEIDSAEKQ